MGYVTQTVSIDLNSNVSRNTELAGEATGHGGDRGDGEAVG